MGLQALNVDLFKKAGIAGKYSYATGATSWTTDNLEEFEYVSLVFEVSGVSGVDSTFTIEESIDGEVYSAVEHSALTNGVVTIGTSAETHVFDFSPWAKKYIKISFDPGTSSGSIDSLRFLAKQ